MIFTIMTEYAFAKRYLQLGIKGYISKQAEDAEIRKAVHTILCGKLSVCPELQDKIKEDNHYSRELDPFDVLPNRELEIAFHLVRSKSVSHIADTLNVHTRRSVPTKPGFWTN
ncbi:hypothetical protein GCM10028803_46550 [Larkinella knui]|uniref:DNA-binding response regulator n=1 Tax=Larkinella knui TaxID=2025310 RepID=A0A3P1CQ96_9BACT|nr:response regulator transcription factor [Larkinella knui]RRB15246.1 DNA-binding response regulator [Larkinella knui]